MALEWFEEGYIPSENKYIKTEFEDVSKIRGGHEITSILEKHGIQIL